MKCGDWHPVSAFKGQKHPLDSILGGGVKYSRVGEFPLKKQAVLPRIDRRFKRV
jgi:hypothetical protein